MLHAENPMGEEACVVHEMRPVLAGVGLKLGRLDVLGLLRIPFCGMLWCRYSFPQEQVEVSRTESGSTHLPRWMSPMLPMRLQSSSSGRTVYSDRELRKRQVFTLERDNAIFSLVHEETE